MSKKTKFRDSYASVGNNDYFGTIFDGMCRSKAYQSLSIGAKQFYTLCRVQAKSTHGRRCLYNHGEEFNDTYSENDFVFPAKHLELYGVHRANAFKYFRELEKAGFIDKKEKNKHMWKVNVYSFSKRWKQSS